MKKYKNFININLAIILLLLPVSLAFGATINVPGDYTTIQAAVNAAVNGDVIVVAPGTYNEYVRVYTKQVVITSSDGPEVTVIHAAYSSSPAIYLYNNPKGTEISGFTITNGGYSGIYCNYSSAAILNNIIENNSSRYTNDGGGIDLNHTNGVVIKGNVIRNNSANTYGGAIHTQYSTNDTICYNLIYDNYGYTEIRCLSTTAAIYNNTIDGNGSRWSGISNQTSGTINCRNNIIVNAVSNGISAANGGYAIAAYNNCCDCANGSFSGPGMIIEDGNISMDPLFWKTPLGEPEYYDLRPFSPCVDAGDPDPFFNECWGSRNDMGWRRWDYEVPCPTTVYVPGDYSTIQAAINASSDCDTIIVAPGTYDENINFQGKMLIIRSSDGAEVTIIHGTNTSQAVVYINSGEPKGTELSGFTIENGFRSGIYCNGSSPAILNNIIRNNSSNDGNDGGGLDLNYTTGAVVRKNIFSNNSAITYGAAIHTEHCTNDTICYNLIFDNYGYTEIRCLSTTAAIFNNTIDGYGSRWSGISNQTSGMLDIRNNIIVNMVGYGVYGGGGACATVAFNDIYNCGAGMYGGNCVINQGGNFSSSPGFWGMPAGQPEEYDLKPPPFSPCVDAGDPNPFFNDPDGTVADLGWRPWNYDSPVLYVPGAYPTIQAAIDAASDGNDVVVSPGTYNENINFLGKRITVSSTDGPDATAIQAANPSLAVVYINSGEPKGTMLSGFTISGGGNSGIYCNGSSPEISNNIIENNSSNDGNDGGGLDLNYTTGAVVKDNVFRNNSALTYGAAIHTEHCTNDTICYNLIYDNYGYVEIRCLSTKAAIYNNTIDADGSRGHGISNQSSSDTIDVRNNIIVNSPMWGIYAANSGYAVVEYNDCYNCSYGELGGSGIINGDGNISANPLFWASPAGEPEYYDLRPFSPCVDAGDPDPFFNDSDDSRNDMGWKPWYLAAKGGVADTPEILPEVYSLSQNYPNPFNASTTIRYNLPTSSNVTIDIYDILGRKITTLVDKNQTAGNYQVIWNANNATSGTYFYRIQTDDFTDSKKMLLLK